MLVPMNALKKLKLQNALLHAAAGPFNGALDALFVMLYTVDVPIDANMLLADLTEPDYTGYARQALVWGGVWQRADGAFVTQGGMLMFQMANATTPTQIVGYALVTGGGTPALMAIERFANPVNLNTINDALLVGPQYVEGAAADYGTALVEGP